MELATIEFVVNHLDYFVGTARRDNDYNDDENYCEAYCNFDELGPSLLQLHPYFIHINFCLYFDSTFTVTIFQIVLVLNHESL